MGAVTELNLTRKERRKSNREEVSFFLIRFCEKFSNSKKRVAYLKKS